MHNRCHSFIHSLTHWLILSWLCSFWETNNNLQDLYNMEPRWWLHRHEATCNSRNHKKKKRQEKLGLANELLSLETKADSSDQIKTISGHYRITLTYFQCYTYNLQSGGNQTKKKGRKIHQTFFSVYSWLVFLWIVSNNLNRQMNKRFTTKSFKR